MHLVPYDDLAARGIRYSRVQLWRLMKEGKFPRAVKLSSQRSAWLADDLDNWIAAKIAERDASATA